MATKAQLKKLLDTTQQLKTLSKDYPLALSRLWGPYCHRFDGLGRKSERDRGCGKPMKRINYGLWSCETCNIIEKRTSQVDCLFDLGTEATLITGGNRAGKTEMGAMFAVAVAAGRKCFWVKHWLAYNGLPQSLIPLNPSTVWASSLSYSDGLEYVRPKLDKFLPIGTKRIRWSSQDRASALLPQGGKIVSMSADSGREKYQGASVALCWLDEEHPIDIFEECLLRIVDSKGLIMLTMTPLKGMTWIYDFFVEQLKEGYKTHAISGLDNPFISSVKLRRSVQHMNETTQNARLYGQFGNQTGLVYSEFSTRIHVVDAFEIPEHWPRYRAIDFGCKNPFCCLWFALDEKDDVLHCYREYFKTEKTTVENGHMVYSLSKNDPPVAWSVADPESKDGRLSLARFCNISTKAAPKHIGVIETINQVKERLCLDANGKPHLLIHASCKQLIKEFKLYRWNNKATIDKPVKKDDHGLDALRYQISFLRRYNAHR